jgi:putative DNA methylase
MSEHPIISPRKLIEVALPLDAINAAAAKEKSIRHGHPSTLHLWWARRPLAAARAVLFAQLVNDPASLWEAQNPGQKPNAQQRGAFTKRRRELFDLITDLVQWKNTTDEDVLKPAREAIRQSWREVCQLNRNHPRAAELFNPDRLPAFHDPFAGGGAIPLEAQRLGLEAWASDLNPVAVLINKAMIEIPPRFANRPPVHPDWLKTSPGEKVLRAWTGAQGLAEDVRYYGNWMREQARQRIGHLYPPVEITPDLARNRPDLQPLIGQKLTVIAWLWARTVASPNPAFYHVHVPLASTFILSSKEGKEAYVHPVIEGDSYRFEIRTGKPPAAAEDGTKLSRGANFRCLVSNAAIEPKYIKEQGFSKRMGARLMAIVAEGAKGRIYLPPCAEAESVCAQSTPTWKPDLALPNDPRNFWTLNYGLTCYGDLFTSRQLVTLSTSSDLVSEAREQVLQQAIRAGMKEGARLDSEGADALAYSEAVAVYLAFAVDKSIDRNTSLCAWESKMDRMRGTFGRQALPMVWDYVETNPFSGAGGDLEGTVWSVWEVLENFVVPVSPGMASQSDAQGQSHSLGKLVSTDPPYYDNIGYADLSDFFYVWLRRGLESVFPRLLATIATPKREELVATPYRHGSKEAAEAFFLEGMINAMTRVCAQSHPAFPVTIYYAFKQSETDGEGTTSNSGWHTFLGAVIESGFAIDGTWPMRSELATRSIGRGTNALASSIVLVCRKRGADASTISRREFLRELNLVLPVALDEMTRGAGEDRSPVAPVDLSQAIIGPGMAVFSKYAAVLEADGTPMTVRTALQLINRYLAGDDFDADTQFCLQWFEEHGWNEGPFGSANTLAQSKGTSVDGVRDAGVIESGGGRVRLLKWSEYPTEWDPRSDTRTPVWEGLHQLIRTLRTTGDEQAGPLLAAMGSKADAIRQLAYRLYTLCERGGRAEDARAYNELITGWTAIETAAARVPGSTSNFQDLPGMS